MDQLSTLYQRVHIFLVVIFIDLFYYLFELDLLFVIETFLLFLQFQVLFWTWKENKEDFLKNKKHHMCPV